MIFTFSPAARRLEAAYKADGHAIYLVGGAVRDTLLNIVPKDFDFTTDATPDEQIETCRKAGFRFIPTGLQHGTITVIVDDELFEVTTMRTESDHDGRYATMTFTRNLNDDLGRRDLTINAMAMDFDGNIFDPYDGQKDLVNRRIRFVGNPVDRIREDYLRILRWVRFHQRLANGHPFDPETLRAVETNLAGLRGISVERVWAELSKALTYDHADDMLDMLNESGIAHNIGLAKGSAASVYMVKDRTRDPVSRLVAYFRGTNFIHELADLWKWSSDERNQAKIINALLANKMLDEQSQRFMVAVDGHSPYYVAEAARLANEETDIENWVVPIFPVSGNDLIKRGIKPGPEMGTIIRLIKVEWAETNYTATKADLLAGY
jgi:tRNA nucleotidyltransferase (CCA-adding enzyme)